MIGTEYAIVRKNLKMSLQARQTQQQRLLLAPNITLALEILRMQTMELQAFLEHQLEENPLLELEAVEPEAQTAETSQSNETPAQSDKNEVDDWAPGSRSDEREDPEDDGASEEWLINQRFVTRESLHGSLHMQWGCQQIGPQLQRLGEFIIQHINEHGYLEGALETLAQEANAPLASLEAALNLIQQLDPPGVGARNLRECLMLQLEHAGNTSGLAYRILRDHFLLFTERRLSALARTTNTSLEAVEKACAAIQQLNPKPGRVFAGELPPSVIPDLIIRNREHHYDVELNDQELPRISISRSYYRMLKDPRTPQDAKEFLMQKFRKASWLIKAIDERNATVLSIARCLISLQRNFLTQGPQGLKPLTQAQVAGLVGRHPSTVSRAIAGKTIDTPFGIFKLEQLFASSVPQETDNKDGISDATIKGELKRLLAEEDPRRPLSDAAIVKRLAQKKIEVARRTIAKYRASLNILPAHLRKQSR